MLDRLIGATRMMRGRDPRLDMLRRCAAGKVPLPVALMQLAYEGGEEMKRLMALALASASPGSPAHERLRNLAGLLQAHPDAAEIVRRMDVGSRPRPEGIGEDRYWAAEFDRAVAVSPEASVALYSFGDAALLQRVTGEMVGKLAEWGALRAGSRVLDYGCGIGRVTAALAPHVAEVVGVDVSDGMLREAAARLSGVANVRLLNAHAFAADDTGKPFDLVLLIDVLPYLSDPLPLLAGLAGKLAPAGSLIAMNWSYDRGAQEQRALATTFARSSGLAVVRNGTEEFSLWDGAVFHFSREARGEARR
jgi:2-polyprenyl-3-methyl-5-hydroxy-6-metoxy-1,4-benzoquinol methylase